MADMDGGFSRAAPSIGRAAGQTMLGTRRPSFQPDDADPALSAATAAAAAGGGGGGGGGGSGAVPAEAPLADADAVAAAAAAAAAALGGDGPSSAARSAAATEPSEEDIASALPAALVAAFAGDEFDEWEGDSDGGTGGGGGAGAGGAGTDDEEVVEGAAGGTLRSKRRMTRVVVAARQTRKPIASLTAPSVDPDGDMPAGGAAGGGHGSNGAAAAGGAGPVVQSARQSVLAAPPSAARSGNNGASSSSSPSAVASSGSRGGDGKSGSAASAAGGNAAAARKSEVGRAKNNVNLMYSDRETETLKEIFSFIVRSQPHLLPVFFEAGEVEADDMCESLLSLSFVTGCPMKMIRFFVEDEFETNHTEEGSIMRANCLASKIAKSYLKRVGHRYLGAVLGPVVRQVAIAERKLSYEINPSVVPDPETVKVHQQLLIQRAAIIVERCTARVSVDHMPVGIRVIAGFVAECAKRYAPKQAYKLVGGFVMLRYLNPALFDPEGAGLLPAGKLTPNSRRNMTLLAKVMQNLANGVLFGKKEGYMTCLNDFLASKQGTIESFFDDVVAPATTRVPVASDLQVVTTKDLHDVHRVLFEAQDQLAGRIEDAAQRGEFQKLLVKLGSYEAKVSFSYLAASDRKNAMSLMAERGEEPSFINWVDKTKRKKVQKRLLIVGQNRILTMKPSGRVAREAHILELREVESTEPTKIKLVFDSKPPFVITANVAGDGVADQIVNCLRRTWAMTFSDVPEELSFKTLVKPESRLDGLPEVERTACGGFVETYRSVADFHKQRVHEELCWDIDNVSSDNETFDLGRWLVQYEDPLTHADTIPLLHALRHNPWYTSLEITDYKFDAKGMQAVAEVLRHNGALTKLVMARVNAPKDGWAGVFDAMGRNANCRLSHVDLNGSPVDDKGAAVFTAFLRQAPTPIVHLDVSGIGCSTKALVQLFAALEANPRHAGAITFLAVANNKFGPDGSTTLWQFLQKEAGARRVATSSGPSSPAAAASSSSSRGLRGKLGKSKSSAAMPAPGAAAAGGSGGAAAAAAGAADAAGATLADFRMSATQPNFKIVVDGLDGGVAEHLDFSHNKIARQEDQAALTTYLHRMAGGAATLRSVNLSHCGMSPQIAEKVLASVDADLSLAVDMAGNPFGLAGARIFGKMAYRLPVAELSLADTDLSDEGVSELCIGLRSNTTITRLDLSHNFKGKGSKTRANMISNIVKLVNSEAPIEALILRGTPKKDALKADILPLLSDPGHLTELDVSGHSFGDRGAVALAKALQNNDVLTRLAWDQNGTGLLGFRNIKSAFKINTSLRYCPLPVTDIAECLQHEASGPQARVELTQLIGKIEAALRNNQIAADE